MKRTTAYALCLLLAASCGPVLPWANHAGMGWRWSTEPTVGYSTPELRDNVVLALDAWGYGQLRDSCVGVNVCVSSGVAHHAGPRGSRCFAEVASPQRWQTVAHEIGHCYGLPHSTDPTSIMCSSGDARLGVRCVPSVQRTVTAADREQLHAPR